MVLGWARWLVLLERTKARSRQEKTHSKMTLEKSLDPHVGWTPFALEPASLLAVAVQQSANQTTTLGDLLAEKLAQKAGDEAEGEEK